VGTLRVTGLLARFLHDTRPRIPDEVSHLTQARCFAAGELTIPTPPAAKAFDLDFVTFGATHRCSPAPPAWLAVLAIDMKLGAPWPVCSAAVPTPARCRYLILVPGPGMTIRSLEIVDERSGGAQTQPLEATVMLALSALVTFMPWRAADMYGHWGTMRPRAGPFGPVPRRAALSGARPAGPCRCCAGGGAGPWM
jgi:hypothetical protein